ncbi:MAG: FAD-dependent oxidoreductase [Nitrospiraceae bacterium]|nr:FAD-dependent oxidoreductase [Nitrospiraceae bacterium]
MRTAALSLLLASVSVFSGAAEPRTYDVVVYGGTAGGVVGAIAAANEGLQVALLEPGRHVGGMVSGGLGRTDFGKKSVIGGMSLEFFERAGDHYGEDVSWFFEPHVAEEIFRAWLDEAGVEVYFGHRVDGVEKEGLRIRSIRMENGTAFAASIYIDASYEGDLLPRAGISYTWGREGRDVYGESLAGRIAHSPKHQFACPVSPYGDDGKLLPLVYDGDPGRPGEGDRKVQAYNFRLCMTKRTENRVPWPRPEGYDPERYVLLARYLAKMPALTLGELCNPSPMPNGKTDTNNNGAISTDYIGGSWEYPEADYARRAEIWDEHRRYQQGFFYFLAHAPRVPQALQKEVNEWGLAKDEFVDTDHWPHQLYIREARRMVGEYVMRQKDLQTERTKTDSIGMGSYNSDSHHVQRIPSEDVEGWPEGVPAVVNEGDMQVGVQPYEIAYRALVPKRTECANLLVTGCVSASHVAYSSIRMEPQYMIMGQAAGVAAALAIGSDVPVHAVDVETLRARLREQRQVLSLEDAAAPHVDIRKLEGVVVDNDKAVVVGAWTPSISVGPYVGMDYLHDHDAGKGERRVRFVPELPKAGQYEVRVSYSAHPNRATNTPVRIHTSDGVKEVTLNQRKYTGNHAPFVSVGVFRMAAGGDGYVEIGNANTDGSVIADAVQWLPAPKE